jgi:hypothetical protein
MHHPLRLSIFLLLLTCCALPVRKATADPSFAWLEPFDLTGWMDAIQSIRTRDFGDSLTSRARLRLELEADFDALYGFVSMDAEKNGKIKSETGIDLQEAWIEYAGDCWDIRIGRQIIIWGKADGVQITDIVSPPDYTESMTRELDEIRMPVDAAKFRWLGDYVVAEFIWIPVFKAAVQPHGDNPWAVGQSLPDNLRIVMDGTDEPCTNLKNSEIALKVAGYFSGLDVAASVFYTWDDYAAYHRRVEEDGDILRVFYAPEHHRLTVFGLEFSRPWSDFVFRGEFAYYKGRYLQTKKLADDPVPRDIVKWLGGVDWSPGNDWTLIAQLTGDAIVDHDPRLADKEHNMTATLNISKELLRQTLTLSGMTYYDLDDNELYERLKAEYAWTDAFHLSAGADIFCGHDGRFGQYKDNTQVWIKAKYSF